MLADIPVKIARSAASLERKSLIPTSLLDYGVICDSSTRQELGRLSDAAADVLDQLTRGIDIELQLYCRLDDPKPVLTASKASSRPPAACVVLFAIIYGPASAFDAVGDFTQDCCFYLQDPKNCDRNVRYLNPHKLSSEDEDIVMSIDTDIQTLETFVTAPDLLADLECGEDLIESETPSALKTPLYRSVRAPTFELNVANRHQASETSFDIHAQTRARLGPCRFSRRHLAC